MVEVSLPPDLTLAVVFDSMGCMAILASSAYVGRLTPFAFLRTTHYPTFSHDSFNCQFVRFEQLFGLFSLDFKKLTFFFFLKPEERFLFFFWGGGRRKGGGEAAISINIWEDKSKEGQYFYFYFLRDADPTNITFLINFLLSSDA